MERLFPKGLPHDGLMYWVGATLIANPANGTKRPTHVTERDWKLYQNTMELITRVYRADSTLQRDEAASASGDKFMDIVIELYERNKQDPYYETDFADFMHSAERIGASYFAQRPSDTDFPTKHS